MEKDVDGVRKLGILFATYTYSQNKHEVPKHDSVRGRTSDQPSSNMQQSLLHDCSLYIHYDNQLCTYLFAKCSNLQVV